MAPRFGRPTRFAGDGWLVVGTAHCLPRRQEPKCAPSLHASERTSQTCANHPAILCYAIGNEITGSIVRWYGRTRVQRFLAELCRVVRQEDPGALVTYVNYPTTEYLELPCVDFVAFNVYLESSERLLPIWRAFRISPGNDRCFWLKSVLIVVAMEWSNKRLALKWQIETIFEAGCAGTFVFAWTDEWNCAGLDIEDWDFGLTTRDRRAKPALGSVARAFKEIPFASEQHWPRISVVVCSYNGAETIDETLTALGRLNYPDYEVIVVDDGSTDGTASIAREHGVRLDSDGKQGTVKRPQSWNGGGDRRDHRLH